MMPFITRRRHDAEMAKVQETLAVAALALGKACEERDTLQSRLDALTPARGQGGRFVGKTGSGGIANTRQYETQASWSTRPTGSTGEGCPECLEDYDNCPCQDEKAVSRG